MTGADLRRARLIAAVRPAPLAEAMGVGRRRIAQIEGLAEVSDAQAKKYLTALWAQRKETA